MERNNRVCPLCLMKPADSLPANEYSEALARYVGRNISNEIILQTDHFQVKPDILPGHPNGYHLLLFPKSHVLSLRQFPDLSSEMGWIMSRVKDKIGDVAFFEHGSAEESQGSPQSVFHAHGHIYATDGVDIVSYMRYRLAKGFGNGEVYSYNLTGPESLSPSVLKGVHKFIEPGSNYLYIQQGRDGLFVNLPDNAVSQITQRSMHLLHSGEVLNWKEIPQSEALQVLAVQRIINLIQSCEF